VTDQQLMREMARKGIHSMTIQSYKGIDRNVLVLNDPRDHLGELERLKSRVDEVIEYGRKD